MGKTSWQVKNKYNAKAYDRVTVAFKKADMEKIKKYIENQGLTMSGYIKKLISEDMGGLDL